MEQPKSKDPQKELEIALSELEERVDRLRASYEQYFMGYEKIEPGVQRKDVDRRFTALRKQQIRNTALRFRFNVITQKFNTYSMYWTRICRQIEEGTYKRHVAKAARRFGGPNAPAAREQDWSIDVELGDFEDVDMDAVLADANAAAEAYVRSGQPADTLPPGGVAESSRAPARTPMTAQTELATPVAAFAPTRARDSIPDGPSSERASTPNAARAARHAPLPPGAKQPILVRRRPEGEAPPPSTPAIRAPMPSSPDRPSPPSSSVIRPSPASSPSPGRPAPGAASSTTGVGAPPSAGRLPVAGPSSVRVPIAAPSSAGGARAGIPGPAASSGRLPAAPAAASASRPGGEAPSTGAIRAPASPPQPAPAAGAPRTPPSAGAIRTPASASSPVAPRVQGYRPAALPPSANRVPVAQGSTPRTPASPMTVARPPEGQNAKAPGAPASTPRAPAPSSSGESGPASDPGRRAPPPLPTQGKQVKKNS